MLYKTHLLIGLLILYLTKILFNLQISITLLVLTIIASLFPDIDEKHSKIGKRFKIISFIFDHRGLFHTVWFALIFSIIIHELVGRIEGVLFFIIYISHLIGDAITKQGVTPFYPIKIRISGNIKVGSILEKFFFLILSILFIGLTIYVNLI